ncbi:FGGY family carbohydrate kinase [Nakamurella sp. GG22]
MSGPLLLALDEGSSSCRTVVVNGDGAILAEARENVRWEYPRPGWVELDPVELWELQLSTVRRALSDAGITAKDLAAVSITTHRETVMLWDRATGKPIHNALVWISKQTDDIVRRWSDRGLDELFRHRTGLFNDSFFSAAKVAWLLENVPDARRRAEAGELACGTPDTWLLWNLTGGRSHMTDHSCASRTALFNLESRTWDTELCALLDIPMEIFPTAVDSDADFGAAAAGVLGAEVPVRAVIADQQAGMFGQACFADGAAKKTFGTAGVLTVNSGPKPRLVDGLTSSVGWTVGGTTDYELEGVVFHSGQTLSWMRENLRLFESSDEIELLARLVPDAGGVYVVPAFGGMCAPHWDRQAKAAIVGMTLESTSAHLVRAALDSMAFQTCDILDSLESGGVAVDSLKVDGGSTRSDLLCQLTADLTGRLIRRPDSLERTALGAAFVAGLAVGIWDNQNTLESMWSCEREFEPQIGADQREERLAGWRDALDRTLPSRRAS